MQVFDLPLAEGRKTTGLLSYPKSKNERRTSQPLIVALHGGTYTASYFTANYEQSISNISKSLMIPVVCVTRPGYGESSLQPGNPNDTWIKQQGQYFHEVILPTIWKTYGGAKTNTTSIVLLAHSVGGGVAINTAAFYSKDAMPVYPLSGIITSGINSTPPKAVTDQPIKEDGDSPKPQEVAPMEDAKATLLWPVQVKDHLLLCSDMNLCSKDVIEKTASLNVAPPKEEIDDIREHWFTSWRTVAAQVTVPHMNTMPEYDRLWEVNEEIMRDFAKAFIKCPRMEVSILPEAPHCIELSRQAEGWLMRAFGFAMECDAAMELKKARNV